VLHLVRPGVAAQAAVCSAHPERAPDARAAPLARLRTVGQKQLDGGEQMNAVEGDIKKDIKEANTKLRDLDVMVTTIHTHLQ
jgi:hypothetical protein